MALRPESVQHLDEVISRCLHCGLCLPVCPTYSLTTQEQSSPRGRIRLMRSLQDGSLELNRSFVNEMYFCLDCQACQTACPAGVKYGMLVEETRNIIQDKGYDPPGFSFFKKVFLRMILASPQRTKIFAGFLRLYRKSGLQEAVDQSAILTLFSQRLHEKHKLLPHVDDRPFDETVNEILPPYGKKRGRVAFLTGCIMNVSLTDIHRDAIQVLRIAGFEVVIPRGQTCCGSLHAHNGDGAMACELARKNVEVFSRYDVDAIVIDSAGCSAFMKEYGHVLADDVTFAEKAKAISLKTRDIMEFLATIELPPPTRPLHLRVAYHDACHLVHTQRISQEPRNVLKLIPGLDLVELPESTWCCGSAGIYNIVRYDDSMKFLDRKMENIVSTDADVIVTGNPGCQLQIRYGVKKRGMKTEVLHPITLLRRSYDPG